MKNYKFNRRNFLRNISFGFLGAGLLGKKGFATPSPDQENELNKIKGYRRLGRTGAMVSDIGSGVPYNESILRATLEAGLNFIETSEGYGNGRNEELIGRVIKNFDREKLYIATKAYPAYSIFKSSDDIIRRAEASLERLQTKYIDLYMIHQAQNIVRVKDDYFHRACDQLKKEGKIRHVGLSCHGQPYWQEPRDSLEDIMMAAIEDGRFDVLFFPYNFIEPDMGERIIKACKEKDIGTMVMKSNPVTVYENYDRVVKQGRELGRTEKKEYDKLKSKMEDARQFFNRYNMSDIEKIKDGAIQFILTNKDVGTICCRFQNFSDVSKYARLSGTTLNNRIAKILDDYKGNLGFLNCRIGCNICESQCPYNIPVNTILRYNYYFTNKQQEKYAMQKYKELKGGKPDVCLTCEGFCEKACPYGVLTRPLLAIAHHNLSFYNQKYT
ncbi:MAG: aldo/keto reductase [Bacteroidales bacterium]|nr:aldo/keto reductase [Bacteroidales bacterium]